MNTEWQLASACRGQNPAMWDLDSPAEMVREGQRICRTTCPVAGACLRDALHGGDHGVVRGTIKLHRPLAGRQLRACKQCNTAFQPADLQARYCSMPCARAHWGRNKQQVVAA